MTKDNIKNALLIVFKKYNDQVLFAYLFGSISQNMVTRLSDIDIAVFLKKDISVSSFEVRLSLYADICRALKRNDIDVLILNTIDNIMLLSEIVQHGMILYDADKETRENFEVNVLHNAIDFREQRLAIIGI